MKVLILILIAFMGMAQAQVTDVTLSSDTRGDQMPSSEITRLQERIRIGFTIDAKGVVEVVGLATTGPAFNNDWATVVSTGTKDQIQLAFRQIYLRKTMGQVTAEAGALSPSATVGAAGLAPSGWMDGIRVRANTKIGNFKVTAGSLGDFKQPNAFAREHDLNFIELEFDRNVLKEILTQTSLELYNGEIYLHENVKYDIKVMGDKVFKMFADALYDFERNSFNYEFGAEFDVLKTLINKYEQRVNFKLYFSNINSQIPGRAETISAFYTYGPRTTVQLGGKIDKAGNFQWSARASLGKQNRYDVGVNVKIPYKKKE